MWKKRFANDEKCNDFYYNVVACRCFYVYLDCKLDHMQESESQVSSETTLSF